MEDSQRVCNRILAKEGAGDYGDEDDEDDEEETVVSFFPTVRNKWLKLKSEIPTP